MLERIIILFVVLFGIFFLLKKFFGNSSNKLRSVIFNFENIDSDVPTILYFWTEQCSQCFNLQKPTLSKLKQDYQSFNLISYNAINETEVVKRLNIKTVPSTVVLSKRNEVKFINNGFATEKLLASQLEMT